MLLRNEEIPFKVTLETSKTTNELQFVHKSNTKLILQPKTLQNNTSMTSYIANVLHKCFADIINRLLCANKSLWSVYASPHDWWSEQPHSHHSEYQASVWIN